MKRLLQRKWLISSLLLIIVVAAVFVFYQVRELHKAHSTFENYYAFRGCTQLIQRAPTYGICKTASGHTITIVEYHGKWYLQGDLPIGLLGHLL